MKIGIVTGGESAERNISIKSAENIKTLINFAETETFVFPEEKEEFLNSCKNFDIVIPMIHGIGGEDGSLQRLLEEIKMPYIFSKPEAHTMGIDKKLAKNIATSIGIKVPLETSVYPLFAKPRLGGSSVASGLCDSEEDFNNIISAHPDTEFILEERIRGREFTVGVIEHQGKIVPLPVIEIIPKGGFFDFVNKYDPENLATEVCPAEIGEALRSELQRQAVAIHEEIGVKHISRSDFIFTPKNEIYFLEINTIPGVTETSLIPKMLKKAGIDFNSLLKEWCFGIIPKGHY